MARGRQTANWEVASALLAMVYNVHCTRQSQTKHPDEFHPIKKIRRRLSKAQSVEALISAFVKMSN
jgi:hypothetical protein